MAHAQIRGTVQLSFQIMAGHGNPEIGISGWRAGVFVDHGKGKSTTPLPLAVREFGRDTVISLLLDRELHGFVRRGSRRHRDRVRQVKHLPILEISHDNVKIGFDLLPLCIVECQIDGRSFPAVEQAVRPRRLQAHFDLRVRKICDGCLGALDERDLGDLHRSGIVQLHGDLVFPGSGWL